MITKQESEKKNSSGSKPHGKKRNYFNKQREKVGSDIMDKWNFEQRTLRDNYLIEKDDFTWNADKDLKKWEQKQKEKIIEFYKFVGGVDISFSKEHKNLACSILVVMSYPELKVVYQAHEIVELDQPYIPGFLAFREVAHIYKLVEQLKKNKPELVPQCILCDGNGILHQNRFGFASHLGVLVDIPTIGCGKTVFQCDGIYPSDVKDNRDQLQKKGEYLILKGDSGKNWGAALKGADNSTNPMIVSVGHKISLETAVKIVNKCCKYRVPEPVHIADQKSRNLIQKAKPEEARKNPMIFRAGDPKDAKVVQ